MKTAYGVPICREIEEYMGREVAVGSVYVNLWNGLHNRKGRWDDAFETTNFGYVVTGTHLLQLKTTTLSPDTS